MEFRTDGRSVFSCLTVPPRLCGWGNLVHGGILSTILDEIMSWAAMVFSGKFILTKTMNIEFLQTAQIGRSLLAVGVPLEFVGKRGLRVQGWSQTEEKRICARSTGEFAILEPNLARKLGAMDDAAWEAFRPLLQPSPLDP